MKKPAWSHSSLKDFEGCQRRYHEVKVLKKYPFQETEATRYGNQVHEAIEHYIRDQKPIPPEYEQFQPVVDAMLKKPGRKLAEYEMALRADLTPTNWKAPDVWVRGIADILIVDDENLTAWVGDWKTGNNKYPDSAIVHDGRVHTNADNGTEYGAIGLHTECATILAMRLIADVMKHKGAEHEPRVVLSLSRIRKSTD